MQCPSDPISMVYRLETILFSSRSLIASWYSSLSDLHFLALERGPIPSIWKLVGERSEPSVGRWLENLVLPGMPLCGIYICVCQCSGGLYVFFRKFALFLYLS